MSYRRANRLQLKPQFRGAGYCAATVPRDIVGAIIGQKGENLTRMKEASGTVHIGFDHNENYSDSPTCDLRICGTPECISKAKRIIDLLVENRPQYKAGEFISELLVLEARKGLIGDVLINQILDEIGARVKILDEPPKNGMSRVQVNGTPLQIHQAKHILRIYTREILPDTPISPIEGGPCGFTPAEQFDKEEQRIFINPRTGEPDYSVQWIEYYRTLNMQAQAVNVERQLHTRYRFINPKPYECYMPLIQQWRAGAVTKTS